MTRSRPIAALALLLLLAMFGAACATPEIPSVAAAPTAVPTEVPTATPIPDGPPPPPPKLSDGQPGLTDDTMRIGVVVDQTFPTVGGQITVASAEAVQAWAVSVNGAGGLAGRTVEVVVLDTQFNDHQQAIDVACRSDLFALVGSNALFDDAGVDQLVSSDCGLPDFPAKVNTRARRESGLTFLSNPLTDEITNAGWASYRSEVAEDASLNAATMLVDFEVTVIKGEQMIEAAQSRGYEWIYTATIDPFATEFEAEAAAMVETEIQSLTWGADGGRLIQVLAALDEAEAELQFVDCGQVCYSQDWVDEAGELGEGVSVWLPTRPFGEPDVGSEVFNYLFWLGRSQGEVEASVGAVSAPSESGLAAWASALLFEEAVNRAVGAGTSDYDPGVLTRTATLAAARTITEWDAKGLHGVANPAAGQPSACFVIMTLRDGAWVRTHPAEVGTMDCSAGNLFNAELSVELVPPDPSDGGDTGGGREPEADGEPGTDGDAEPDEEGGDDLGSGEPQIPTPNTDDG